MMKQYPSIFLLIVFFAFTHLNCKKEPPVVPPEEKPPVYQQSIFLTVTDSGLTEIYLKLSITDSLLPRGFSLYRNNAQILSGSLFGKETTLVDTAVHRNTQYFYQAYRVSSAANKDSSNIATAKTLDTTSHEFAWTKHTFGNKNSSVFYGLAMVNDTTLYALGTVYINDSICTIAKYDKGSWSLKKLFYTTDTGDTLKLTVVRDLFVKNNNSISLFSASIFEWDGTSTMTRLAYSRFLLPNTDGTIDKSFGSNTNDIFGVGRSGSIIHLNGSVWQTQTSGTMVDLTDVWGTPDGTGMWAGGYTYDYGKSIFLEYKNGSWNTIWTREGAAPVAPYSYLVTSMWWKKYLYVCSGGEVFKIQNGQAKKISPSFNWLIHRIRGYDENDIVVVTEESAIWHFNGLSWKKIYQNSNQRFKSVAMSKDKIIAVGNEVSTSPGKAIIIEGKR